MSAASSGQLALNIGFQPTQSFATYRNTAQPPVSAILHQVVTQASEPFTLLWGPSACGKSHLLQACGQLAHRTGLSAAYIPMARAQGFGPEALAGLETFTLICLDDVDRIGGDPGWEEALFHHLNQWRATHRQVIVTATAAPDQLPHQLPDLRSRLQWGLSLPVPPPSDADKVEILIAQAASRGIELPEATARYLLDHFQRDLHSLSALLARLDRATLRAQRRLTLPFVRDFLHQEKTGKA